MSARHRPAAPPRPRTLGGSYDADDVVFLLKPVLPEHLGPGPATLAEKERAIQSGRRHYAEMAGLEAAPDAAYQQIFDAALDRHGARMGRDCAVIARSLDAAIPGPITLLSLVRAGTPPGAVIGRCLRALGRDVAHFGVSIIRDRGLDIAALGAALAARPGAGAVFIDGWTGKGAIAGELEADLARRAPRIAARLAVIADPGGRAWLSASFEDWLIPSGVLGASVSGLVGRSILNDRVVGPGDFHATIVMEHLRPVDRSRGLLDVVGAHALAALPGAGAIAVDPARRAAIRAAAERTIARIADAYRIANRNRIKPGVAEATRAVLRRAPERVLVGDRDDPDLAGLLHLAAERGVAVEARPALTGPYRAITLIGDASPPS